MTEVSFISHCGTTMLIGVNGKDMRGRGSSGRFMSTPYMAYGNDEIAKASAVPETAECPKCYELVPVQHAEGKPVDVEGRP